MKIRGSVAQSVEQLPLKQLVARSNRAGPTILFQTMITKDIITVDEYVLSHPKPIREILNQLRSLVKKLAPKAEEKMSYGMPTYKLKRNVVHFAAYPHHIGFYPAPSGISAFQKELSRYK